MHANRGESLAHSGAVVSAFPGSHVYSEYHRSCCRLRDPDSHENQGLHLSTTYVRAAVSGRVVRKKEARFIILLLPGFFWKNKMSGGDQCISLCR